MQNKNSNRLVNVLVKNKMDCFIAHNTPAVRYLTGFSGSNGLCFLSRGKKVFFTDFRYQEQVKKEVHGFTVVITKKSLFSALADSGLTKGKRVGFLSQRISHAEFMVLSGFVPKDRLVPCDQLVDGMREIKTADEIFSIQKAARMADGVFAKILPLIKPGVTEIDIASEISHVGRRLGSEKDAFEVIALSGKGAALPHGKPSAKKIKKGEMVLLDFGCIYNGYHSDMTRTVFVGRPLPKAKEIYYLVLSAQERAIKAAKAGMKAVDLDAVARSFISDAGYGEYFGHGLGHGIGLEIHEGPRVSFASTSTLAAGNVVTIEPGIYVPSIGGVRIEDDVVITKTGCTLLTHSPKELIEL